MANEVDVIYQKLAEKYKLDKTIIKAVCNSQFELLKNVMVSLDTNKPEECRNVRLWKLGLFYTTPERIKAVKEHIKRTTNGRIG